MPNLRKKKKEIYYFSFADEIDATNCQLDVAGYEFQNSSNQLYQKSKNYFSILKNLESSIKSCDSDKTTMSKNVFEKDTLKRIAENLEKTHSHLNKIESEINECYKIIAPERVKKK